MGPERDRSPSRDAMRGMPAVTGATDQRGVGSELTFALGCASLNVFIDSAYGDVRMSVPRWLSFSPESVR
jgi:hypothetical protein